MNGRDQHSVGLDELAGFDRASKPRRMPGPHPVMAAPDPAMCPDRKRLLQQAMSDSYSCSWVHDLIKP